MIVQIKHIILFLLILRVAGQVAFSQDHKTWNNFTGEWETPERWNTTWPVPQTNVNNLDITINGYITANSPLSFSGSSSTLIVDDTLVIKGDLTINDDNDVQVNNNGILIVMGNTIISDNSHIIADGYIIITGNIKKLGSTNNGSFISNDNPVKLFIGGTISPTSLTITKPNFIVFNCSAPATIRYPYSGCSYGDMTDILIDSIFPFFQSICPTAILTSSDADNSFCAGTSVTFTAGGGTNYNFRVNGTSVQNGGSTTYTTTTLTNGTIVNVIVTSTDGCIALSAGITNTVFTNPIAIAGPDQQLEFIFETQMKAELSSSETGEWSLISGSGRISDIHSPTSLVTELSFGINIFLWKVQNSNCEASAEVKITVHDLFVPSVITPDGDGKNDYFKIRENTGKVYLIIFNRWGIEEYKNYDYKNDWDGRNNKGAELPVDTYFYVLKFENGKIRKGSVLIKR